MMSRTQMPQTMIVLVLVKWSRLLSICNKRLLDLLSLLTRKGNLDSLVCRHVLESFQINRTVRGRGKGKSSAAASTSERASSRFNSKYFGEIIVKLDERKKIIRDQGFGILLEYDGCSAPRGFVQWIADKVDLNCCDIVVGGKVIPFSAEVVHLFLGLPIGGEDIRKNHNDSAKTNFLSEIDEASLPLIKTFGEKLLERRTEALLVAADTFLLLIILILPTLENVMSSPKSAKDPLFLCWKGSMINKYASYDRVSGEKYGKRPVKSIKDTCYAEAYLPVDARDSFRNTLDKHNDFIHIEDRDSMCKIFENHHTRLGYRSPDTLVAKMFKYMHERYVDRDDADCWYLLTQTEKIRKRTDTTVAFTRGVLNIVSTEKHVRLTTV